MSAQRQSQTCPKCHEDVGNLPAHLRHRCTALGRDQVTADQPESLRKARQAQWVTTEECRDMRESLLGEDISAADLADGHERSQSTIARHVNGECTHEVDAPAMRWSDKTRRWVQR